MLINIDGNSRNAGMENPSIFALIAGKSLGKLRINVVEVNMKTKGMLDAQLTYLTNEISIKLRQQMILDKDIIALDKRRVKILKELDNVK